MLIHTMEKDRDIFADEECAFPSTILPIRNYICLKGEIHSCFGHEMESCTVEFVFGPMFARRTFFVFRVEPLGLFQSY